MLQLVGFRKARMSSHYLTSVECQKIHKKSKKFPVTFELALNWSNGQKTVVERPYMAVFDFENLLKKNYPDCQIPELKDARWLESLWKARKEEKKKAMDEFFQKILSLPEKVLGGKEISEFFTFIWQRDSGSEVTQQNSVESETRAHSTAVISPVECEYESIDIEKGDYSTLSIRPKSVAVFQNTTSKDTNSAYWAVTEYSKRKSGEVDLSVGAVVNVLQRELSGWWFVHVEDTNEQGWAPGACLLPDDRTNLQDCSITGPLGEFQVLRDFEGVEPDEVSCKKGEKVEVIQASLDGWWEVRCRGKVGIIPATNLEPMSNQAKFRGSLYHQVGIYKKDSPPPRRNSKLSVEELYGKVDKFRKKTNQSSSSTELGFKKKKSEPIKTSSVPPQLPVEKQKTDDGDDSDDDEHLYMNDMNASTKHFYVNLELKSKRNASGEKKYYRNTGRHEPSFKHDHRPVLVADVGDIIESHIEENNQIYGRLYRLANGSQPDINEGWISKTCLELYELEPDDVMRREAQGSNQRFSNVDVKKPIPPKRLLETKPSDAQDTKSRPKPLPNPKPRAESSSDTSTSSQPSRPYVNFCAPPQCKVHRLSRTDCESILLKSATCCQYIIRESTKAGHFVLSVRSSDRVHNFPIKFTPEKTYFIGDYNFDTLTEVVSYYTENALFESENGSRITLGTSLDSF